MLLDNAHLQTQTNCNVEGKSFSIKASPVAFDILSSKLYSNPTLAIVRELLTNAYDSHKAAGKEDVPIKVNLPSYTEPNFIIRDYGIGLSKEDVLSLYTTFFDSTKSNSNDFTGCFGLGSKTPFSYTSSFSVISYWNGIKYFFIATKKDGLPHIYAVKEEPTDEPNGLEVSIPTDKSGGYDINFLHNMIEYLKFIPEIKIECNLNIERETPLLEKEGIWLYKYEAPSWSRGSLGNCYIKQGQNVYETNKFIKDEKSFHTLKYFLKYSHVVMEVPIGTLHITPSRESLSQDEENISKITSYILEISEKLKKTLVENIEEFNISNSSFVKMFNEIMTEKYFSEYHPLKPKLYIPDIDGDGNTKCKLQQGCYLHKVDSKGMYKNSSVSQEQESIILLAPSTFNERDLNKLRNTINNYEELEDISIYIVLPYGNKHNANLLRLAKLLKGTIWILNNIHEYSFDIKYQTINEFYRKYTNHKKARIVNSYKDGNTRRIRHKTAILDVNKNRIHIHKNSTSIVFLKSRHPIESTLIVCKEKVDLFDKKLQAINYFLQNVKDSSGNNFVRNKLIELLPKQNSKETFCFVEVSGLYKKHFKDYTFVNLDDIFNYIRACNWLVSEGLDNDLIESIRFCDKILRNNFKPKVYEFIKKTKTYKKLIKIVNIINKYNIDNTIEPYEIKNINSCTNNIIDESRLYNGTVYKVLPNKVKILLDYCKKCRLSSYSVYNKKTKEYSRIQYYVLSKQVREEILLMLKGDL